MKDAHDSFTGDLQLTALVLVPEWRELGYSANQDQIGGIAIHRGGNPLTYVHSTKRMAMAIEKDIRAQAAKLCAPGRGGKRSGSGRKGLDPLGTVVTTIRLTGEQRATLEMLGGVQWLRDYLQSHVSG